MTENDVTIERPSIYSMFLNALPMLFLVCGFFVAATFATSWPTAFGVFLLWLYLVPPLVCRCLLASFGRPSGAIKQSDRAYRVWWAVTQLQMPFNRMPFLEELLRLAPGLYALWIWLWGGSVSPLAFVAPGVTITDRFAVHIAKGAVLGTRSSYAGHMVTRDASGQWTVLVAAPEVCENALVSGDAGLGPGAKLLPGAFLPYGRKVAPLSVWPKQTP
jgi:hypothetical protein